MVSEVSGRNNPLQVQRKRQVGASPHGKELPVHGQQPAPRKSRGQFGLSLPRKGSREGGSSSAGPRPLRIIMKFLRRRKRNNRKERSRLFGVYLHKPNLNCLGVKQQQATSSLSSVIN